MSYESDERYWTDYLRVALPVVGLLLMLGLLFWWANSIIGDEQGTQPTSTVAGETNVATAETNTPVNTTEPGLTPTAIQNPSTPDDNGEGNGTEITNDQETPEAECDGDFARSDLVQITDSANFRPNANLEEGEFTVLPAGTQAEIVSDCYTLAEDDETRFWRLATLDDGDGFAAGDRGYVAEELFEAAE